MIHRVLEIAVDAVLLQGSIQRRVVGDLAHSTGPLPLIAWN